MNTRRRKLLGYGSPVAVAAIAVLLAVSCAGGGGNDAPELPDDECGTSNDCDPGDICDDGQCVPFEGCSIGNCPAGQVCGDDFVCKDAVDNCQSGGCDCQVLGSNGAFAAAGESLIALPERAGLAVNALLLGPLGTPLPNDDYSLAVEGGGFTVSGKTLTASAGGPVEAILKVSFSDLARCSARLHNLGPVVEASGQAADAVRVYVFNSVSGAPISGAHVIVDINADGDDDGSAPVTDESGITTASFDTGIADDAIFSTTVFADGYDYVSYVGLEANTRDLAVALEPRTVDPVTGAFSGRLSFVDYIRDVLGGEDAGIRLGLAGASIPFSSLLGFSPSLLAGAGTEVDCEQEPESPGCYRIRIGSLVDTNTTLPGSLVMGFSSTEIKPNFEVVGTPGRRHGWSVGSVLGLGDLGKLIALVQPLLSCDCDITKDVCDEDGAGECSCDLDCGLNLDLDEFLSDVVPLFSSLSSGFSGNLPLQSAPFSEWEAHVLDDRYNDRQQDERFPVLDNGVGDRGDMRLTQRWSRFSAIRVPLLPPDWGASQSGVSMEGMLAATGVNPTGFGFLPLGIGAALDCTHGDCSDRSEGQFDGRVNGLAFCDPESAKGCLSSVTAATDGGRVADGEVGLFHGGVTAGFANEGETLTLLAALPVSALLEADPAKGFRASAILLRGALEQVRATR